ncbi:trehalose-phosphatase [Gilvimarinus sp. DA14]|uniref:trehalose-phosphatase n=1 Tax=Gilvimarinus sp. DA14 TaxID=2956798 RepID=UPI0020B80FCB|nr:trehalose-phosphatase [Gilvimarinus sp. DA14]UTF61587.1 trehalose-phosphatase [Gilvimarinus sp. DA14]
MTTFDIDYPAFFLDFDGTLVDFAEDPEAVLVPEALSNVLSDISLLSDGALALVSGRSIQSLSSLVKLPLSMAGSHGAEWCVAGGEVQHMSLQTPEFVEAKAALLGFAEKYALIAEDKGHAIAIHYRVKPELKDRLDHFIDQELALSHSAEMRVIRGNCVREIQPCGVDKGFAIARFMSMPAFKGRAPIYIGDDTTDEDGFAWVNAHGGVSLKVGGGDSCAVGRLSDTGEVLAFLHGQLDKLRQVNDRTQSRAGTDR